MRFKLSITALLLYIICIPLVAQGIKGSIKDISGEALPFASIYVKALGTGTSSNLEGNFSLNIPPGAYNVTFQFMGYTSQVRQVEVGQGFSTINVVLTPQIYQLAEVVVSANAEDPSYTIMRKAITKAKYHLLQNDSYSAEVYVKGTGQLTQVPWFLKKTFEKEGVDTSQVFTSESVSEIYFERPNTFKENVISVRASGQDMANANPNAYINSSFYLPKVVNAISPLSPSAFSYYRFEYQGSFMEGGVEINKIKVTPRSNGDEVFTGEIYIRENFWNIHSLDLTTSLYGFDIHVKQIYAPVNDDIWMPVTQQYDFSGKVFGLGGTYTYLASVSNYKIVPNEDLGDAVILVDEKIAPAPEEIQAISNKNVEKGVQEVFEEEKEVSRKQFKKLMKEYEKAELEQEEEPDVISDYSFKMDTLAARKDSIYWARIRPVPLTTKEIQGYQRDDSVYVAEKVKRDADSLVLRNGNPLRLNGLLFGGYYKLGERLRYRFPGFLPQLQFNAVEGLNLTFTGNFEWRNDTTSRLKIYPSVRYGFASDQLYGKVESVFGVGNRVNRGNFRVSGGSYIEQFNPAAIGPFINSIYTLLYRRNYMKLYEKDFVKVSFDKRFRYKYRLETSIEWANRSQLVNNSDFSIFDVENRLLKLNRPNSLETPNIDFNNNKALIASLTLTAKPWLKFRRYNGQLIPLESSSPEIRFSYRKGINAAFYSDVQFDHLELGLKKDIALGVRAVVDIDAEVGTFLGDPKLQFMDFKHFGGNRLGFAPIDVSGNFRALDYYKYSTAGDYFSIRTHVRFRKLLFTQLPMVRLSGVKENLFVNYLNTMTSDDYMELGYTLDNVLRILRIEFVQSLQGWEAREFVIRIGVASLFNN